MSLTLFSDEKEYYKDLMREALKQSKHEFSEWKATKNLLFLQLGNFGGDFYG